MRTPGLWSLALSFHSDLLREEKRTSPADEDLGPHQLLNLVLTNGGHRADMQTLLDSPAGLAHVTYICYAEPPVRS